MDILKKLFANHPLILASNSPRRQAHNGGHDATVTPFVVAGCEVKGVACEEVRACAEARDV